MGTGGNGIRFERAWRIDSRNTSIFGYRAQRLRSQQLFQQFLGSGRIHNGTEASNDHPRADTTSAQTDSAAGACSGTDSGPSTRTAAGLEDGYHIQRWRRVPCCAHAFHRCPVQFG